MSSLAPAFAAGIIDRTNRRSKDARIKLIVSPAA
jgi:hypothetical protein